MRHKVRVTLSLDKALKDRLEHQAEQSGRSLSNLINYLLTNTEIKKATEEVQHETGY